MVILLVLLSILKTIGIILLVLLAVAILLALIVLFVPVRYEVSAAYDKEHELVVHGNVSWLLHLVFICFGFAKKFSWYVKILGKRLAGSDVKKKSKKKRKKKKSKKGRKERKKASVQKTCQVEINHKVQQEKAEENTDSDHDGDTAHTEHFNRKSDKMENKTKSDIFKDAYSKVSNANDKLTGTINGVAAINARLTDPDTAEGIRTIVTESVKLIRGILPRRLSGCVGFGTGDDYTEGLYLGIISMFYPLYVEHLIITPYWDKEAFDCNVKAAGRIYVFLIVAVVIRLYKNKKTRKILGAIMKK